MQIAIAIVAGLPVALGASTAEGTATRGRQPPGGITLQGLFYLAPWEGDVSIQVSDTQPRIESVTGILPGTCHDDVTGRTLRVGRDGAIGVLFVASPNALIRPDGSFSFTAKAGLESGYPPHTITMRGTFYGNNVLGRVRGRSGSAKYNRRSNCSGDQPFWAKRVG